jgi:hypothetical protein
MVEIEKSRSAVALIVMRLVRGGAKAPQTPPRPPHVGAPIEAPNRAGTGWRKISDAMETSAPPAPPGRQGSRGGTTASATGYTGGRPSRPPRPPRQYEPAVMRGLTNEQRKALDAASAAALHCEAGGAEPPRDAVRVVDNVRTIRPDLLLHSRERNGIWPPRTGPLAPLVWLHFAAFNKRRNTNLARETRTLCPVGQPALNPWVWV